MSEAEHPASFRDPGGFLFKHDGVLYRQINQQYGREYDHLIGSGLYQNLTKIGRLITHQELDLPPLKPDISYKIIQPETIPFISYPYEWSFSQLKEAALVTLLIQQRALNAGLSLKDASAYNIQFLRGKAILIDTLSFEFFQEGQPWVAYKQFCQHFLAPLALMAKKDIRLGQLLRIYIDGVPLDLASKLLPGSTRLNPGLAIHLHMHARAQTNYAKKSPENLQAKGMSKQALLKLLKSLENTVRNLDWEPVGTEWRNYYEITNYSDAAFLHKKQLVAEWVKEVTPGQIWDLGANTGVFSQLAAEKGIFTVAFDVDPAAVGHHHRQIKADKEENILPLILDLANPSPAIGWQNQERESLMERGPVEMVFALALIHHLAISNNVPLSQLAKFFSHLGKWLIIEYIPKSDSQVQKLLRSRRDIFHQYTQKDFEKQFEEFFKTHNKVNIRESDRVLYLMERE